MNKVSAQTCLRLHKTSKPCLFFTQSDWELSISCPISTINGLFLRLGWFFPFREKKVKVPSFQTYKQELRVRQFLYSPNSLNDNISHTVLCLFFIKASNSMKWKVPHNKRFLWKNALNSLSLKYDCLCQ